MKATVIVWDLETVPDLGGFAAANDLVGKSDVEVREAMGDKFPKHLYHSIICIGALIAHRNDDHWVVDSIGTPHVGNVPKRNCTRSAVSRRGRHPLAIAAECSAGQRAVMTFQDGDLLSGLRIPDARGAVSRRGHHLLAGHADPIDDLLNDRVSLDTP
jgi:hypothetical protein